MASYITRLALAALALPAIFAAPTPQPHLLKIRDSNAKEIVKDSYIVVYNDDISATSISSHEAHFSSLLSRRSLTGIGATYHMAHLKGYQVTADSAAIAEIAASPDVAWIEKDAVVRVNALKTETGAPYGLGRISHTAKGSTSYIYDSTAGAGVTLYVVDTGILTTHQEFQGRATMGANYISGSPNTDEYGHGTHVSGTMAGVTYGVAKSAKLVGVKVLDKNGSGTNSGVIQGIQWVATNAVARSVLSMSLGGGYSAAVNNAVKSAYANGVTVVVAAGNDDEDASNSSPASEATAITVGAIDSTDTRASFSNFGTILDIFAPGVNTLSAWIGSNSATKSISGTSMATPHVAGLAAYLIALEGLSTPAKVVARITALATAGKVIDPQGSKNLIAYNGSGS